MDDEEFSEKLAEAEDYYLQAEFIHHSLQANLEVYGSNSSLSGGTPADVGLAIQYLDRCLEYFPDSSKYLNLKALFLGEGLGQKDEAIALLKRAHEISPRDINVANNLKTFESSKCFIATAAYGTPFASEVSTLRKWRDSHLKNHIIGRIFISSYYFISPPLAHYIEKREWAKRIVRTTLKPLASRIERQKPTN